MTNTAEVAKRAELTGHDHVVVVVGVIILIISVIMFALKKRREWKQDQKNLKHIKNREYHLIKF